MTSYFSNITWAGGADILYNSTTSSIRVSLCRKLSLVVVWHICYIMLLCMFVSSVFCPPLSYIVKSWVQVSLLRGSWNNPSLHKWQCTLLPVQLNIISHVWYDPLLFCGYEVSYRLSDGLKCWWLSPCLPCGERFLRNCSVDTGIYQSYSHVGGPNTNISARIPWLVITCFKVSCVGLDLVS